MDGQDETKRGGLICRVARVDLGVPQMQIILLFLLTLIMAVEDLFINTICMHLPLTLGYQSVIVGVTGSVEKTKYYNIIHCVCVDTQWQGPSAREYARSNAQRCNPQTCVFWQTITRFSSHRCSLVTHHLLTHFSDDKWETLTSPRWRRQKPDVTIKNDNTLAHVQHVSGGCQTAKVSGTSLRAARTAVVLSLAWRGVSERVEWSGVSSTPQMISFSCWMYLMTVDI